MKAKLLANIERSNTEIQCKGQETEWRREKVEERF